MELFSWVGERMLLGLLVSFSLCPIAEKANAQIDTMVSHGRLEHLKSDLIDYHQSMSHSRLSTRIRVPIVDPCTLITAITILIRDHLVKAGSDPHT